MTLKELLTIKAGKTLVKSTTQLFFTSAHKIAAETVSGFYINRVEWAVDLTIFDLDYADILANWEIYNPVRHPMAPGAHAALDELETRIKQFRKGEEENERTKET